MSNNKTRRLAGCVYQSNNHEISVNLNHFKETTEKDTVKSIYEDEAVL